MHDIALSEGGVARNVLDLCSAIISPPYTLLRQRLGCGESRCPGKITVCLYDIEKDPLQEQSLLSETKRFPT